LVPSRREGQRRPVTPMSGGRGGRDLASEAVEEAAGMAVGIAM
jgi:hypothetical protein